MPVADPIVRADGGKGWRFGVAASFTVCPGRREGRDELFPFALCASPRRQEPRFDTRAVPGGAGARWLRWLVLLSRPRPPAIDAGGNALLAEIEALIGGYPPYSDQREQFSLALYGTSETLKIDGEGRVVLSDAHKSHAGIMETVAFVGLGYKFRIWEPGRFRAELVEATDKVRAFKQELGTRVAAPKPLGARE